MCFTTVRCKLNDLRHLPTQTATDFSDSQFGITLAIRESAKREKQSRGKVHKDS
jgi:hypothetical protein